MNSLRIIIVIFIIRNVYCTDDIIIDSEDIQPHQYKGEKFPVKYLEPEDATFTPADLDTYLSGLKQTVQYFAMSPNNTDGNTGIGLFFMKSVLKRVMRDHGDSLSVRVRDDIKYSINLAEYIISHYTHKQATHDWNDIEFRLSRVYLYDESHVYSIAKYNKNNLKRWILSDGKIHDYLREMDEATLPREKYVEFAISMNEYFSISDSDNCLTHIALIPEPVDVSKLYPCQSDDPECHDHLHATPSIAYALSHRFLLILARRLFRRCYIHSEAVDDAIMGILCSYMYREAVYIARRGYFARDLFLEHIALCSMLGYEEFLRRSWFTKIVSWMDEDGCITETWNYVTNSTKIRIEDAHADMKQVKRLRKHRMDTLNDPCHSHPMALLVVVLSHAVRYTFYKTQLPSNKTND